MLKGRERELAYLNKEYQSGSDRLLVVYGQKDVGKTALLAAFTEDKKAFYYQAEEVRDNSFICLPDSCSGLAFRCHYIRLMRKFFSVWIGNCW